jgi:flagellar basal body-associated protein FliL
MAKEAAQEEQKLDDFVGGAESGAKVSSSSRRGILLLAASALVAASAGLALALFVLTPSSQADQPQDEATARQEELKKAMGEAPATEAKGNPAEKILFDIANVLVNVAGTDLRRYIKASITLDLKDEETLKKAQAKATSVEMTDKMINILSSKTIEDIDGPDKKHDLKQEIRVELSSILGSPDAIKQVYFNELLVQ